MNLQPQPQQEVLRTYIPGSSSQQQYYQRGVPITTTTSIGSAGLQQYQDTVSTNISNQSYSSQSPGIVVSHNTPYSTAYQHSNLQHTIPHTHYGHHVHQNVISGTTQSYQTVSQPVTSTYKYDQSLQQLNTIQPNVTTTKTATQYLGAQNLNPEATSPYLSINQQKVSYESTNVQMQQQPLQQQVIQQQPQVQQPLAQATAVGVGGGLAIASAQIQQLPQQQQVIGQQQQQVHMHQPQQQIMQQQQKANPYQNLNPNQFSSDRWIYISDQMLMHVNQIPLTEWIQFFHELELLFNHLGYAFAKAFGDLRSKIDTLQRNDQFWTQKGVNLIYLQDIIDYEIQQGLAPLNAKGNQASRFSSGDFRGNYASSARTILRNLWLLDYMYLFLHLVYTDRHSKLSKCAQEAYKDTLAQYHSWTIRKIAELGMRACPGREVLLSISNYEQINKMKANMWKIKEALWSFYRQRNIQNLL